MERQNLNLGIVARKMARNIAHVATNSNLSRDAFTRQEQDDTSLAQLESSYLAQLEAMPKASQRWLSIASYFAAKAPKADAEDWQQEIYLRLCEAGIKDTNAAFTYASRMHLTLWRNYRRHSFFCEPMSSETTNTLDAEDPYASRTVADIASDVPFMDDQYDYVDARIDAKLLWHALNATPRLKAILSKRLLGAVIPSADRMYLMRFLNSHRDVAIAHS